MRIYIFLLALSVLCLTSCSSRKEKVTEQDSVETEILPHEEVQHKDSTVTSDSIGTAEIQLIDFSATWCGPCRQIAPFVHELEHKYAGKVSFKYVDIDKNPELANTYGVQAVPTFVIIETETGSELNRVVGADPTELEDMIKEAVDF